MSKVEERIVEEVKKHEHLYNPSSQHYKDCQMANNSWKEISSNAGLDVAECMKKWKNLRDKYVRLRKKLSTRSGDPGSPKMPAFYNSLSWLEPHVKHREPPQPGASSPPASRKRRGESPPTEDGTTPKKKWDQEDWFMKHMALLEERRVDLQQKLLQGTDECSRFGQTVADMLRRVPEERRPDVMFKVYGLIHDSRE
ncbi:uncharacterized protein V6R79_013322 [Siganus canaliculatus]